MFKSMQQYQTMSRINLIWWTIYSPPFTRSVLQSSRVPLSGHNERNYVILKTTQKLSEDKMWERKVQNTELYHMLEYRSLQGNNAGSSTKSAIYQRRKEKQDEWIVAPRSISCPNVWQKWQNLCIKCSAVQHYRNELVKTLTTFIYPYLSNWLAEGCFSASFPAQHLGSALPINPILRGE